MRGTEDEESEPGRDAGERPAFPTMDVEPDAADYECDQCGEPTVVGAEEALMLGLIEVV